MGIRDRGGIDRPAAADLYLDIETDRREITVLGLLVVPARPAPPPRSYREGVRQWVGRHLTARAFCAALPRSGRLFTFNGAAYDIPWVERATGVDLERRFECVDLMYQSRWLGLRGGQKGVERAAGFVRYRDVADLRGRHAVTLWRKFLRGDSDALRLLLRYNRVDLYGLRAIHEHLERREA